MGVAGTLRTEGLIMLTVSELPVEPEKLHPKPEEGRKLPMEPGFMVLHIRSWAPSLGRQGAPEN